MRTIQPLAAVPVLSEASASEARLTAREHASRLGFEAQATGELVIVASELCFNIARHAGRGEMRLSRVDDPERGVGLELSAWDEGPRIADFDQMLQDGWSDGALLDPVQRLRARGIGAGLGAVRRLTDEVRYEELERGKAIRAVRFVRAVKRRPPPSPP